MKRDKINVAIVDDLKPILGRERKTVMTSLIRRPAWNALSAHAKKIKTLHLRKLFADDPKRGQRLTMEAAITNPGSMRVPPVGHEAVSKS
jgi:hypothetical protein